MSGCMWKQLMQKAVENTKRELATIRSGKATTSLLDTVKVDAYGQQMPLNQVGTVAAPEPRMLTVQPWDKALIGAVEKAIMTADLGLNPANDGTLIRIPLPPLTEACRPKRAKASGTAVRRIRGVAMTSATTSTTTTQAAQNRNRPSNDVLRFRRR